MTPTTPIQAPCAPASTCCVRCPARHGSCSATWPSSAAHAADSHAALGRYARECGVARLFALGPESTRAVETFGSGGEWFADADSLARRLQAEIAPGVTVLVKGSRVNRLERVVQALLGGCCEFRSHDASELTRMLLYLTEYLARRYSWASGFHVFQYLTLRGILAAMTALAIAMVIGPRMISLLSQHQIGQRVRSDGPQSHLQKSGTPTMGGGLILVAMVISTLLWADLGNRFVWVLLGTTLAFGAIGFYDDYLKLVVGNSKGLPARYKYLAQSIAALSIAFSLHAMSQSLVRGLPVRAFLQGRGLADDDRRIRGLCLSASSSARATP